MKKLILFLTVITTALIDADAPKKPIVTKEIFKNGALFGSGGFALGAVYNFLQMFKIGGSRELYNTAALYTFHPAAIIRRLMMPYVRMGGIFSVISAALFGAAHTLGN